LAFRKKLRRDQVLTFFASQRRRLLAMADCVERSSNRALAAPPAGRRF
jgi:hypothetical protein